MHAVGANFEFASLLPLLFPLIEPELASGMLVEPFAHRLKSKSAYYLVHARGPVSPALARFRDWLTDQDAASAQIQSRKATSGG